MAIDLTAPATLTAPAGVDGRGEVATFNGDATAQAAATWVGFLTDDSGFDGPPVRVSMDEVTQGPGAVFGAFQDGPRSFTLEVEMGLAATPALSFARRDKLYRAFNAKAADGTFSWTETGGTIRQIGFRREQPPRGPVGIERKVLLGGICADPRIYAGGSESTASAGTSLTLTNAGNVGTLPRFTVASPSATITFTNSTTGQSLSFVGLDGSGTLTVDFLNKTVTRGGVNKYSKVDFVNSTWWELAPGANSVTVTNAATPFFRSAWL